MTRRERLMATMRGEPVDRLAVSFYEINGLDEDDNDPELDDGAERTLTSEWTR